MKVEINAASLALVRGDITKERVDTIVNAANERLMEEGASTAPFTAPGDRRSPPNAGRSAPGKEVVQRARR